MTSAQKNSTIATSYDAKGDLLAGTGADAFAKLTVGTNNTVLTADSSTATGLKWASPALTLVKSQTIGTTVSSVTVTDAFSSTYDNYAIWINLDTASAGSEIYLTLGATTSGYVGSFIYMAPNSNTVNGSSNSNNSSVLCNYYSTDGGSSQIFIGNPNKAKKTTIFSNGSGFATAANTVTWVNYYVNNTTQYTAFTLTPSTGTLTGGTIRVYGYQNSQEQI